MLHHTTQEIIADHLGKQIYLQDQENAKTLAKVASNLKSYAERLQEESKKIARSGDCKEALYLLNCIEEYMNSGISKLKTEIEKANTWCDCRIFVKNIE